MKKFILFGSALLLVLSLFVLNGAQQVKAATHDGDGTMTISPTGVNAGSTGNTFTFTFQNNLNGSNNFPSGSSVRVTIPAGWTTPQKTSSSGAGFVGNITDVGGSGCAPGSATISGSGPWTIDIPQACQVNQQFTFTYSNVTAPAAGSYPFTTLTKSGSGGTLTNISTQPTVVVKGSQTITVNTHAPSTAIYGGTFSVAATASSGLTVAITTSGSCTISSGTVTMTAGTGTCTVNYNQVGNSSFNAASQVTETTTAQTKGLTVNGITASNKTYDGTTAATINANSATLSGVINGDLITLNGKATATGVFSDKNVATAKTITVSGLSISGTKAANYSLTQPTAAANITPKSLTIIAAGVNKVYDATTAAQATLSDNRVGADIFTDNFSTASFVNANVGTAKTVNVSGISTSGTDANNYTFNTTATTAANITARPITAKADNQTKQVGDPDPILTHTVTSGGLAGSDAFSGALCRDPGETAGSYTINQGSLSAGSNYNLTFISGTLTISAAPTATVNVIVTVDNSLGGTKQASDFTVTVTGGNPSPASFNGSTIGTAVTVGSGTAYTVSASSQSGYAANPSVGCSATPNSGDSLTCTITESFSNTIPAVAGNLIVNPDLQTSTTDPTKPDNWSTGGFDDTASFTYPVAGPAGPSDVAAQVQDTNHIDGDAKWIFDNVSVEPGALYTFSDWYKSDVSTSMVAALTATGQTDPSQFIQLGTLPATSGNWTNSGNFAFTIPLGFDRVTVYHLIGTVGTLTTDHYALVKTADAANNIFPQGMVSLTFDDGWATQYDNALPILQNAKLPATFYIITDRMNEATQLTSDNLLDQVVHGVVDSVTAQSNTWTAIFTDPTNQKYRFTDSYTSTATGTVEVTYQLTGSPTVHTLTLGTLPASPTSAKTATFVFTLPLDGSVTVTNITLKHSVSSGTLTVLNSALTGYDDYMNATQLLALQAGGNEIGAHTTDHCDLVKLQNDPSSALASQPAGACEPALSGPSTPAEQIDGSRTALQNIGATPVDTFAYPYGSFNSNTESLVDSDGFVAARSVNAGYNTKNSDPFALDVQIVDSNTTLAQVENWVSTANANHLWLILLFHQVEDQATITANGDTPAITPQMLTDIVNYIQSQNISVKTLHDGFQLMSSTPAITPDLPVATPAAGTYNGTQSVSLTSNNSTSIHYTLDSTDPSCTTGTVYSGSISISGSSDLKAVGCNSGNGSAVASFIYTIDSDVPVVTIDPVVTPTANSTPSITFTAVDGFSVTTQCKIDTDAFADCTSPFTPASPLSNGPHTITVQATDLGGNVGNATSNSFVVDTIAPTATVAYDITTPTGSNVIAKITPSEPITDTNNPTDITDNGDGTFSHTFTANGSFEFDFKDAAGNAGSVIATVSNIDSDIPGVSINPVATPTNNNSPVITFTATDTFSVTTKCQVDAGAFADCTSPFNAGTLADGSHTATVKATDAGGNTFTATSNVFVIDTTAPTASVSYQPTAPTNGSVIATIHPSEHVASTNSSGVTDNGDGTFSHTFTANGSFEFDFKDDAGNTGSVTATVSNIDTTALNVSLATTAVSPTNASPISVTASFSKPVSDFVSGGISVTNGSVGNFAGSGTDYTFDVTPNGDGTILISNPQSAAHDAASNGNVLSNASSISCDSTAPVLSVNNQTTASTQPTITGTSNDSVDVSVTINSKTYTAAVSAGIWSVTVPAADALTDGVYPVLVSSTDQAGNIGTASGILTVNTTAPTLSVNPFAENAATITGSTDPGATVTVTVNGTSIDASVDGAGGWSADLGTITPDGTYPLQVAATNSLGTQALISKTLIIDTTPPVITLLGSPDVTIQVFSTYTDAGATALDNIDGDISSGIAVNSNVDPNTIGDYTVTYSIRDAAGNAATPQTRAVHVVPQHNGTLAITVTVNGGTATPDQFTFSVNAGGNTPSDPSGVNSLGVAPGTYSVVETPAAGYTISSNSCTNVVVTPDNTNSCAIVNEFNPPAPVISSEGNSAIANDSITITWVTDHPSTSRVVYDTVSHPDGSLGSAPNYGYANSTIEDSTLVTNHSVVVSGLSPGTAYFFRAVSHGSPEAVGAEFSISTSGAGTGASSGGGGGGGGSISSAPSSNQNGQVLGAQIIAGAHPDGSLILSGSTIFLIKNGQRYGFRDPNEYKSYGYNFSQAVVANSFDLSLPFDPGNILKAMPGTLVLDAQDHRTVYMIGSNGTKRGFASAAVFKGLGYSFSNLLSINLSDYPAGAVINSATAEHPEGALVLDGKTVWWIINGTRQGFESEAVFNTYGFTFSRVVAANAADLNLPQGDLVKFRDGTLVTSDGNYYIISDGAARQFSSLTAFLGLGYLQQNAINASLANYQTGTQIAAAQ